MNETVQTLTTLRERVAEVLKGRGLELWQVAFLPDGRGGLEFHLFAGLVGEETPTPDDDGFDEVIASARAAEAEQRRAQSIAELQQRLRSDGGFLDF